MSARHLISVLGVILFSFAVSGCGERLPSETELRAAFQMAHPGAEIVKIDYDGEDASTSYIWFHYRTPGDTVVQKTMWQYTDSGEGKKKRVLIPPQKA